MPRNSPTVSPRSLRFGSTIVPRRPASTAALRGKVAPGIGSAAALRQAARSSVAHLGPSAPRVDRTARRDGEPMVESGRVLDSNDVTSAVANTAGRAGSARAVVRRPAGATGRAGSVATVAHRTASGRELP